MLCKERFGKIDGVCFKCNAKANNGSTIYPLCSKCYTKYFNRDMVKLINWIDKNDKRQKRK